MLLRRIVTALPRFAYRFGSEIELHDGIAKVLADTGIAFEREYVAGPKDRFDFLVDGIVIEAKVKGAFAPALQQCARYAARDDVGAVVLVTTRYWGGPRAGAAQHAVLNGKPFRTIQLRGQSF